MVSHGVEGDCCEIFSSRKNSGATDEGAAEVASRTDLREARFEKTIDDEALVSGAGRPGLIASMQRFS
jgi:hypothetical protein